MDPITTALAGAAADKAADVLGDALNAVAMGVEAGLNREDLVARVMQEIKNGMPVTGVSAFVVKLRDEALQSIGQKP